MIRAVIVDDEELSIDLIKYLIKRHKLPIEIVGEASSGDEAVDVIKVIMPDLVFIDIRMPVMNGLEVMEEIRSFHNSINFIIITAYSYFEYAQAALRLGAKDILLKPVEPELFLETIERVLGYKSCDNEIFNEVLQYINNNYNGNIELKLCADKFHTSSSYIARMFKRYCNTTFIKYLNELRIKEAIKLFETTNMPIKEVAFKVGFNNLNYFYKIFKKYTGTTPNIFKNSDN